MFKKVILGILAVGLVAVSCSDDDDGNNSASDLVIKGGPFDFCAGDGIADLVSEISVEDNDIPATDSTWVITDAEGTILGLPPMLSDVEANNFDGAGDGKCLIWYLKYQDSITGASAGMNANDLQGNFTLSNPIDVNRTGVNAGTISGGPFNFTAGDGMPDMVSGITIEEDVVLGTNSTWVVTDADGKILGLPGTLEMLEANDFDGAGVGTCLIWYLRFEDGLQNAEIDNNASDLEGCFDLSNPIEVVRN